MRKWRMLLAMSTVVFAMFSADEARAQVMFGPQVTLFDFDDLGIGARADYALGDAMELEEGFFQHVKLSGDVNYLFNDSDVTTLLFNVNGIIPFESENNFVPYAGAGINHFRSSFEGFSSSASGLNLLGGLMFGLAEIPAFAQAQYSTSGNGFITLSFGVLFGG